jgi:regulator of protease activity HflC (stomatin/prohibitin superfamily)
MVWTKDKTEGSVNDDSMTFQTKEGLSVNTDIGITYSLDPKKVSVIFQKYRKGVEEITAVYLRSMVRDALVQEASSRAIESVYGEGKADLITRVQNRVQEQTKDIGIIIEKIYFVGDLRLPEVVTTAINAKITATQMAAQRENEVAQSKAEADKLVAEARGRADSRLLEAKAEAEAIKIKGDALSQNPKLVELSAVEKWDGKLPTYMLGSSTPFIQVPSTK